MAPAKSQLPLILGGVAVAAIGLGILVALLLRHPKPVSPEGGGPTDGGAGGQVDPKPTLPVDRKPTLQVYPKLTLPVEPKPTLPVEPKPPGAEASAAQAAELIRKASRLQQGGDTGAARDLLEQAVQLAPKSAEAHFRLARLFHMTQPQRAKAEYEAAAQLGPEKYGEAARLAIGTLQ
jgi:tetratricopeptide (TPR) repeat protein